MTKIASLNSLKNFLIKCHNNFASINHTHTKSEITDLPDLYYRPGDIENIRFQGAGFITTGATSLRITIPLNKPVTATKATLSGSLTLRQGAKYIFGDADETTSIDTLTQNFLGFFVCGATFNIESSTGFTDATNNDAVGILFIGTIKFT